MDEPLESRSVKKSRHIALIRKHWHTLAGACGKAYQSNGRCMVRVHEADLLSETLESLAVMHPHENIADGHPIMIAIESYNPCDEIVVMVEDQHGRESVYVVAALDIPPGTSES